LLVGFCAQLVAATFLSQSYSMFFTLAFAMSAALNRMAGTLAGAKQGGLRAAAQRVPFRMAVR
jgi:hypothetical protein